MDTGDKVRFINNLGEKDDAVCEIIDVHKDHIRLKKPDGVVFRIYKDRVFHDKGSSQDTIMNNDEFDPRKDLPNNGEIWVKYNSFNDSVICKTYAIIDPKGSEYKSINTYNGVAKKMMSYPMKNYAVLINKLQKRGYEKED